MKSTPRPYYSKTLRKIQETLSNKELTLGCKLRRKKKDYTIIGFTPNTIIVISQEYKIYSISISQLEECEIIGHPVMIGDVITFILKTHNVLSEYQPPKKVLDHVLLNSLITRWKEPQKPITEQSKACIQFVYSIITT